MDEDDNDDFNLAPFVKMKMQFIAVGAKLQFWKMTAMLLQLLYFTLFDKILEQNERKIAKYFSWNIGIVLLL